MNSDCSLYLLVTAYEAREDRLTDIHALPKERGSARLALRGRPIAGEVTVCPRTGKVGESEPRRQSAQQGLPT